MAWCFSGLAPNKDWPRVLAQDGPVHTHQHPHTRHCSDTKPLSLVKGCSNHETIEECELRLITHPVNIISALDSNKPVCAFS